MAAESQTKFLIDIMTLRQKRVFWFLVTIWAINLFIFFYWWIDPSHIVDWPGYLLTTALLIWTLSFASYFYFFLARMKKVNPSIDIPEDWRVAMVVTKVPSEPFEVLQQTLQAMLEQQYPHDTWLADEDPTDEVRQWCRERGIRISSRKGIAEYHRKEWPRRTKSKEGNLAYFYDTYGYENYDFVVQLDADHIPQEHYLEEMLRPFVDDGVGYVSAPSICNLNEKSSWAARGRLYSEVLMHGSLQAGYTHGYAPLCIGSHYAVRTKALREIGGLGPELAEDHSTTLIMNGHGWKGVHAFDALAYGEGPETFADCITQEFQWSRSLVVLMLTETPRYWRRMPLKLRLQFLFSQMWYPLFSLALFVGFIIPVYAVFTREPLVSVSYFDFIQHSLPITLSTIAVAWFIKLNKWYKPADGPVVSWEAALFNLARWPWSLYGSISGMISVITKKQAAFKVTPKGVAKEQSLSWKVYYPYILIVVLSFLPSIFVKNAGEASGYYLFLIMNMVLYLVLMTCIILIHLYEARNE